ncbi:hypothetical protein CLV97_102209 [Planifilum fimeticola]|uniref:Uncharacterized protein n=1 Tax=Planifilum fimeticola TaxID=201975 RepID=A0A2T0LIZ3_9BACL|nr:hypothetical protein CLV97_102209 [Planifilum fimeticola]
MEHLRFWRIASHIRNPRYTGLHPDEHLTPLNKPIRVRNAVCVFRYRSHKSCTQKMNSIRTVQTHRSSPVLFFEVTIPVFTELSDNDFNTFSISGKTLTSWENSSTVSDHFECTRSKSETFNSFNASLPGTPNTNLKSSNSFLLPSTLFAETLIWPFQYPVSCHPRQKSHISPIPITP